MRLKFSTRFGYFYGCGRYPKCSCTHGCHQHNGKPLGVPANAETRQMRSRAHEAFDLLWKTTVMKRSSAYRWLKKAMKISKDRCHISKMNTEQCIQVISLSENRLRQFEPKKG